MGLKIPNLDNKDFELMMQEALAKLPSYTNRWTDYNTSDPGISIIELLVWMADINFYRLNRVGEEHYLAFLKLLGTTPKRRNPAKLIYTFNSGDIIQKGKNVNINDVSFRTIQDLKIHKNKIIHIYLEDKSGIQEVHLKNDFYPFGITMLQHASCNIAFKQVLKGSVELFCRIAATQGKTDNLKWQYQHLTNNKWIEIPKSDVKDQSNSFTNSGNIYLKIPPSAKYKQIQCVLQSPIEYETSPKILSLYINTTMLEQRQKTIKVLGRSNGYAKQRFKVSNDVLLDSIRVKINGNLWSKSEALLTAMPDDMIYFIQNDSILFGDGAYGSIPPHGAVIKILCDICVGGDGNVDSAIVPAWGGKDQESIQEAFIRVRKENTLASRAVTIKDYEILTLQTPHTNLAKVKATANKQNNEVSLLVIPHSQKQEPQANTYTNQAVLDYLNQKRLLTTNIHIIPKPKYTPITVYMKIYTRYSDPLLLETSIRSVLETFFHPLYGGRDAKGWEFGEDVHVSTVYILLNQIKEIEKIESIYLSEQKQIKISIDSDTLPRSGQHKITVQSIQAQRSCL